MGTVKCILKYFKVIIITTDIISVIVIITLNVFEQIHDYNYDYFENCI